MSKKESVAEFLKILQEIKIDDALGALTNFKTSMAQRAPLRYSYQGNHVKSKEKTLME